MKIVRHIAIASAVLALAGSAFAQEIKKPEAAGPQAEKQEHRGEHRHGQHGMRHGCAEHERGGQRREHQH